MTKGGKEYMSKYAFLGLFFTVLVVIMGGLTVNHMSSTNAMQEIDVGLESAAIGVMRESDGDKFYAPARDLIAELTTEIAEKQTETGRVIEVSYKLFDKNGTVIPFNTAITNNSDVYSVQYKVDLYKEDSAKLVSGKWVLKPNVKAQSSTENRISLNQN